MKHQIKLPVYVPRFGLAAIILALLSGPAFAADDKPAAAAAKPADPAAAPDMADMMKKMEEISAPGPKHKLLSSLAGEWEAEVKSWMGGPDGEASVSKGTCKRTLVLGGRFLQEEFHGEMGGMKFNGMGLMGYDKFNKKYVNTWVDDMGTGIFISEGSADATGKVVTHTGKMDEPFSGEKAKPVKMITRILSPDKNVFEMHDLGLGEKSKVMEITYTRKKAQ